jgi:phosphocarrier protein HPr
MTKPPAHSPVVRLLEIKNRLGLHARAAARLVQAVSQFDASITITKDEQAVDGKSILGLMMLAAGQGSTIEVSAVGADAREAMLAIETLVDRLFDEGE